MAIDAKYGRVVTEHGTFGEDEPVVVFRAQDQILPELLMAYYGMCLDAGSPRHHLTAIMDALTAVHLWQKDHVSKVPSSDMLAPVELD